MKQIKIILWVMIIMLSIANCSSSSEVVKSSEPTKTIKQVPPTNDTYEGDMKDDKYHWNIHLLDHVVRSGFKKGVNKLSDYFKS